MQSSSPCCAASPPRHRRRHQSRPRGRPRGALGNLAPYASGPTRGVSRLRIARRRGNAHRASTTTSSDNGITSVITVPAETLLIQPPFAASQRYVERDRDEQEREIEERVVEELRRASRDGVSL